MAELRLALPWMKPFTKLIAGRCVPHGRLDIPGGSRLYDEVWLSPRQDGEAWTDDHAAREAAWRDQAGTAQ